MNTCKSCLCQFYAEYNEKAKLCDDCDDYAICGFCVDIEDMDKHFIHLGYIPKDICKECLQGFSDDLDRKMLYKYFTEYEGRYEQLRKNIPDEVFLKMFERIGFVPLIGFERDITATALIYCQQYKNKYL